MPKPTSKPEQVNAFHAERKVRLIRQMDAFDSIQVLQLPGGLGVSSAREAYLKSGLFEFAEPDYLLHFALSPDDPYYTNGALWHLHNTGQNGGKDDADIDGPEGWNTTAQATNVIVAIVDTGIRYTHEDLANNMWRNPDEIPGNGLDDDRNGLVDDVYGINAVANQGDPFDVLGHGTQVAGIAGAVGNNGRGVTGVSWQTRLMACRFYDDAGMGSVADAVVAIDYARNKGAKIINASWISTNYVLTLYRAIERCGADGIIFVAAAGNSSQDNDLQPYYPASYDLDNIVSVAATTRTDGLAGYSNFGQSSVDLAAPGSGLTTTSHSSDSAYVVNNGTSFASPMVAGALALVQTRYPKDNYPQTIDRVLNGVDPLSSLAGKCVTGGRLNLATALGPSLQASFVTSPTSGSTPLTVSFTDTSFGVITNWSWTFGDGSASDQQHPTHIYVNEGNYTASLTVRNDLGLTSTATVVVAVVANYKVKVADTPFSWIDPSNMAPLPLSDNGVSPAQLLPFPFRYYGRDYTELYVSANGLIGFDTQSLSAPLNMNLPQATSPNNIICPFWDDLNPGAGGSVRIGAIGTSPKRKVVISWVNVPQKANPPANYTFQILLEEESQGITFQYLSVVPGRGSGNEGRSATVGVENASGTVAALYSFNGSVPLANNTALMFEAPPESTAPGMLEVLPLDPFQFAGFLGGSFAPAAFTYTLTNSGGTLLEWTALPEQDWMNLSATGGNLAPGESASIDVVVNDQAKILITGLYTNSIAWRNSTTGRGDTDRDVSLTVATLSIHISLADPLSGSRQITLKGIPGYPCQVEASTNLFEWMTIANGTIGTNGIFMFDDTSPMVPNRRFYRGLIVP